MKRVVVWYSIMSLLLGVIGCGSDDERESKPTPILQNTDNTYLNTKFLVKITELPPKDKWTIKKLGTDGQGKMVYTEPGMSDYILLLMEPIPENQFIDLDKDNDITNIINAGMPFIEVMLTKMDGVDIPTFKLPEIIKQVFAGIDLNEAKPVAGANNSNGYQVTAQFDLDNKLSLSYFVKKDILVQVAYIAQNTEYDKYLDVYNNIVKNLTLMGM